MNNIKTETKKIESFLVGNSRYRIHEFQRTYKWNKEQVLQLIDDLQSPHNEMLFLGSIILSDIPKDLDGATFEIVDGQQRIVTITMLIKSIELILEKDLSKYYYTNDSSKAILTELKGQNFYESVLDVADYSGAKKLNAFNHKEIIGNFKSICTELKKIFESPVSGAKKIEDLLEKLLNSEVVITTIPSNIPSPEIFESINSKGKPLTVDELIKNYFYIKVHTLFSDDAIAAKTAKIEIEKVFHDVKTIFDSNYKGIFSNYNRYFQSYIDYKMAINWSQKKFNISPLPENNVRKLYTKFKEFIKIENKTEFNKELKELKQFLSTIGKIRTSTNEIKEIEYIDSIDKMILISLTFKPYLSPLIYYLSNLLNNDSGEGKFITENFKKICRVIFVMQFKNFISSSITGKKYFNIISFIENQKIEGQLDTDDKNVFTAGIINILNNLQFDRDWCYQNVIEKLYNSYDVLNVENISSKKVYKKKDEIEENYINNHNSNAESELKEILFLLENYFAYKNESCIVKYDEYYGPKKYYIDHCNPQNLIKEREQTVLSDTSDNYLFEHQILNSMPNLILLQLSGKSTDNLDVPANQKINSIYGKEIFSTNYSKNFYKWFNDNEEELNKTFETKKSINLWANNLIREIEHAFKFILE